MKLLVRGGYNGLLQNFVLVFIEFPQLFGFIGRSEKVQEFRYLHSSAAFCFASMDCQLWRSFYLAVLHLHAKCLCTVPGQMRLLPFIALLFFFSHIFSSANLSNSCILWAVATHFTLLLAACYFTFPNFAR